MSAVDGTVGPWSLLAPIRTRMRAVVALSVLSSVATVASLVGIIDIAMTYPEAPEHRTWLAVAVIVVAATVRMAADGAAVGPPASVGPDAGRRKKPSSAAMSGMTSSATHNHGAGGCR